MSEEEVKVLPPEVNKTPSELGELQSVVESAITHIGHIQERTMNGQLEAQKNTFEFMDKQAKRVMWFAVFFFVLMGLVALAMVFKGDTAAASGLVDKFIFLAAGVIGGKSLAGLFSKGDK